VAGKSIKTNKIMTQQIIVRKYQPEDTQALAHIFFNTIHLINSKDYTKEQVDVWAPITSLDGERWSKKFLRTNPFVAVVGREIVGFAEFEPNGHIDCFYCHHEWIGKGVGSSLMRKIHEEARQQKIDRIFSEVSITAKPFFERHGFATICEQTISRNGVELINYKMEKFLDKNLG
jgi:putative acetyltransferase